MQLNLNNAKVSDTTNILDIEVPKEMEKNIPTGMTVIDRLFAGDGVTPSTAAMITGCPGAGKSTLLMQLADSLTKQGHIVLYNTGEESLYQVRRTTKRLGLQYGFIVGSNRLVVDIINHAKTLQKNAKKNQKVFLIQDSLQCLDMPREEGKRGRPVSGSKAQIQALSKLTEWAKETYGVMFVIGMVNKKGEFAGKNEIKHIVDCHLHLGYEITTQGDEVPCVEMTKNRFGVGGLYYNFDLTEQGLVFHTNRNG